MKYCTNCGNSLNEHDEVCPACNTVVKPTGVTPPQVIVKEPRPSASTFSSVGFSDSFWVSGLRSWGQLLFLAALIGGAIAGYLASNWMWSMKHYLEAIIAFAIAFLPFAIGGFLLVALMMVLVEMASDIAKIRYMLQNRKN